ncbi:MAG TPA: hypothetical protein VGF73_12095 [Chthoniobacterales bacterium]
MKRMTLVLFALVSVSLARAATPAPAPTPACTAAEFRQFDFWLGKWKVTDPKGKETGTSEISRASEGCAVREEWKSARGMRGMSINYYDQADRRWHQDWVGGDGTILHLRGGMEGNAMVLKGDTKGPKGIVSNRITYTPLPGGKVKQEWAVSNDAGQSWQISFLGIYEKQI